MVYDEVTLLKPLHIRFFRDILYLSRTNVGEIMKKILAQRLKQCRKEKGFTQWQVAVYCDMSEKTYQNYELMTREPKPELLIKIADLYEVSLDYLVGRTDEKR